MANFLAFDRFLWVVLQLDCLCRNDIETDDSIRRSLQDMPKDLHTLFSRILQRAKVTGPSFQSRLLKILVAAQRPLTLDEMREALSIIPGDTTWRPQQQINNIAHALASCGSLVAVDEEEETVRFVHQSVSQFLLQGADNETTLDWHFTSHQASLELGQLLVTYLNYGIFDQQLSTTLVPNISAGQATTAVVRHVFKDGQWRKAAALKLLRLQRQRDPDLGRIITEVSGAYQRSSEAQEVFHLLSYARRYWFLHTRTISSESLTFSLWEKLLTPYTFAEWFVPMAFERPPGKSRTFASRRTPQNSFRLPFRYWTDVYYDEERYIVCAFHPRVLAAIVNSHLGFLSIELRGKHALKALCGAVVYLLTLQKTGVRPRLERPMWHKLWKLAHALSMEDLATDIFHFCNGTPGRLTEQHDLKKLHEVEQRTYARVTLFYPDRPVPDPHPHSRGPTKGLYNHDE